MKSVCRLSIPNPGKTEEVSHTFLNFTDFGYQLTVVVQWWFKVSKRLRRGFWTSMLKTG